MANVLQGRPYGAHRRTEARHRCHRSTPRFLVSPTKGGQGFTVDLLRQDHQGRRAGLATISSTGRDRDRTDLLRSVTEQQGVLVVET